MKIRLSIIIAMLMLALLTITASAADLTATTDSKSCAVGSTVTINVSISESVSAMSGAVEVIYDNTKLQLIEAKWNTDGSLKDVMLKTFDFSTNMGGFSFAGETNISKGKIFSATFKVLSGAPVGDTPIECILQLKHEDNQLISISNTPGNINITCNHSFTSQTNAHPAGPATCTKPASYYYSCSICGARGNKTYTAGSTLPHTYNKRVSAEKYLVNSVDCVDAAEFYYSCECGAIGEEIFTGDASWTHSFGADWFVGTSGHWYACTDCGARKDYSNHSISNGVCNVCFFVIENDADHTHSHGIVYKTDDTAHWYECYCGDKKDYSLHSYDNGRVTKESTETEKGEVTFVCTECYHTKTEELPLLEAEKDNPQPVDKQEKKTMKPIAIILITAGSIIGVEAIAFVVFIILKKRNEF